VLVPCSALTVKLLHKRAGQVQLRSENPAYAPMTITECEELLIWGVVTNVVHAL
jgi:DNA polymerase V